MEYEMYNPADENEYDNLFINKLGFNISIDSTKSSDIGYNKTFKWVPRSMNDKQLVKNKIEFYTSSSIGSNIRDAKTGEYYNNFVGTREEDLYFKVVITSGECKSKNKSYTLFFVSPTQYASHMYSKVSNETIAKWEKKRDMCLKILEDEDNMKKQRRQSII